MHESTHTTRRGWLDREGGTQAPLMDAPPLSSIIPMANQFSYLCSSVTIKVADKFLLERDSQSETQSIMTMITKITTSMRVNDAAFQGILSRRLYPRHRQVN